MADNNDISIRVTVVNPRSSIRPQVLEAAAGNLSVEPHVLLRTPQRPSLGRTIPLATQAPVYGGRSLLDLLSAPDDQNRDQRSGGSGLGPPTQYTPDQNPNYYQFQFTFP